MLNKKWKGIIAVVLICVMIVGTMTACAGSGINWLSNLLSPFDPTVYVKGNLDVIYFGEASDEYLKMAAITKEELQQTYEDGLNTEADSFISYFDIDEDKLPPTYREEIIEMYREIYSYSKYEVDESTKTDDGYVVNVTVYPMDIIQKVINEDSEGFMKDWNKRIESGEFDNMSDAKFEETWARSIIDLVKDRISTIDYLEPQTISVQINLESDTDGNRCYTINNDDFLRIDQIMIQY